MPRTHPLLLPALLYLALAVPLAASWSPPGDEGTTFDQAIGPVDLGPAGSQPVPMAVLAVQLDGDAGTRAGEVLDAMRRRGMHPPAYTLGVHFWTRAFGTSPSALRLPGLVLGLLALLGLWAFVREIRADGPAATWAAALLAASATFVHFSLYLRPYALALPLMTASLWLLLRLRTADTPRREGAVWTAWVAVHALGLYTLYHHAFFLAWQGAVLLAWALLAPKRSRAVDLAKLAVAGLALVVLFAPWLGAFTGHLELTAARRFYFKGFPETGTLLPNTVNLVRKLVLRGEFGRLGIVTPLAELALLTALLLLRPLLRSAPEARRPELRIFWLSVPLLPLAILASDFLRGTHTAFLVKTMLAVLPLAAAALALGATAVSRRGLGNACLVAWLAIFLAASASQSQRAWTRPSWQQRVAEQVRTSDREDHLVVVSSQDRRFLQPLLLSLRDAGVSRVLLTRADRREIDAALPRLLRDEAFTAVTLVSFGDDEGWLPEWRPWALTTAHLLGWRRVRHGVPALVSLERGPPAGR